MRESLFKGKTIEEGKWIEVSLIIDEKDNYYIGKYIESKGDCSYYCTNRRNGKTLNRFIGIGFTMVDKDTVCEYTQLKDKTGKRIWEKDIVRELDYKPQVAVVKFGNGYYDGGIYPFVGWYYQYPNDENVDGQALYERVAREDFEVIGNSIDNPELLKESEETE